MTRRPFIVAIDGPAGAGKSTASKILARLLERMRLKFQLAGDENRVFLDGQDVTAAIRAPAVSMIASRISAIPSVRKALLPLQRKLALQAEGGAVLEGRDIGTVVFPDADAKFFLDASPEIRARRRYEELFQKGIDLSMTEVLADQTKRDRDDSTREVAPLRPAEDAIVLDSSLLPVSEVVQTMERIVRQRMAAGSA